MVFLFKLLLLRIDPWVVEDDIICMFWVVEWVERLYGGDCDDDDDDDDDADDDDVWVRKRLF